MLANDRQVLRLGTRSSLLAKAQSRLVAAALCELHPDLSVTMVELETRGDRDLKTPLSRVKDPNFFSGELDTALQTGEVDFCVHSLKDLDKDRPDFIRRAAIPSRENPRDVIIFRSDVIERLRRGQIIRIGSSSIRRQFNIARFLGDALPNLGPKPRFEFIPLRGPVDQRLASIAGDPDQRDALDGVVLALAGLARLWGDTTGRSAIEPYLKNVRWMVLPLSACPTAPGQGALALECRRDDEKTCERLRMLHDPTTASLVQQELDFVASQSVGQQPRLGVTALQETGLGALIYVSGPNEAHPDHGNVAERICWDLPPPPGKNRSWDGAEFHNLCKHRPLTVTPDLAGTRAVFVAHWHAITDPLADNLSVNTDLRIWVSGLKSWRRLADRGLWVEGCAENLGFASLVSTLSADVLQLPPLSRWTVLTRRGAESSWAASGVGRVIATYALDPPSDENDLSGIRQQVVSATHFFWGSIEQYRAVRQWISADAQHACGTGKTAQALHEAGLGPLQLFPNRDEWRAWLR